MAPIFARARPGRIEPEDAKKGVKMMRWLVAAAKHTQTGRLCHRLTSAMNTELLVNIRGVPLHCDRGNMESVRDLFVAQPACQ
jgi:hypothetical protein